MSDERDWVIRIRAGWVTNYIVDEEPTWNVTQDLDEAKGYETKSAALKAAQAFSCVPLSDAPHIQAVKRERGGS